MKITKNHPTLGEIVYNENNWTGKKSLFVNGKELTRTDKTTFVYEEGENKTDIKVEGNFLKGAALKYKDESIEISPSMKWYEILLSVFIVAFVCIWGNITACVQIFPIIGGAIGGAISGLFAVLNLICMKAVRKVWLKIIIWVVFFAATMFACFAGAMIYLDIVL